MQAIVEYRLRVKAKKQGDIKNEDPSQVKFSCRSCSKEVCTGRDIEVMADIHRVNVTPQFRWELLRPERTSEALSCSPACSCRFVQFENKIPFFFFLSFNRELFILKENNALENNLLDYELNGYIACGTCGQVGNRCETLPIVHERLVQSDHCKHSHRSGWVSLARRPCMDPPQAGLLTRS